MTIRQKAIEVLRVCASGDVKQPEYCSTSGATQELGYKWEVGEYAYQAWCRVHTYAEKRHLYYDPRELYAEAAEMLVNDEDGELYLINEERHEA